MAPKQRGWHRAAKPTTAATRLRAGGRIINVAAGIPLTGPCPKGGEHVWRLIGSSGACNKCGKYQMEWREEYARNGAPTVEQPAATPPDDSEAATPSRHGDSSYRYAPPRVDGRLEANRDAAADLLHQARTACSRGDNAEAIRLVLKSLRLYETDDGREMHEQLRAWGAVRVPQASDSSDDDEEAGEAEESASARAVHRILSARGDHLAVLDLPPSSRPTAAQIRRAYKQLSLSVHPDRNDAEGAEEAFKLVKESFGILIEAIESETVGDVFRRYASSARGLVSFDELRAALASLRRDDLVPLDSPHATSLLGTLERESPDGVSVGDFRALVKALKVGAAAPPAPPPQQVPPPPAAQPRDAQPGVTVGGVFRQLDPMGTGVLAVDLLSEALRELGIARDKCEAAVAELTEQGVQQMSMPDFRAFVKAVRGA